MKMKKTTSRLLAVVLALILMIALFAACGNNDNGDANQPAGGSSDGAGGSGGSGGGGGGSDSGGSSGGGGSSDGGGASSDPGRTLNVAVSLDAGSLHPFSITGSGGWMNLWPTYVEPLLDTRADGTTIWILCTGVDMISDIQYTMHIREGVTFSNGNPLTAEDVVFSMECSRDNPQFYLNVKAVDFEKTKVIDDYTIDFWMTEYNVGQFPGMCQMPIFDKESYDEIDYASNPIGTGPYIVVDYVVNSHLIVEARDDYWGTPPSVRRIHFKTMNEDSQRVNAIATGDVDMARIPLKDIDYVESLGNTVDKVLAGTSNTAFFNMTEGSILGTPAAREAVCFAIDRESIVDMVHNGQSSVPRWPNSEVLVDLEPRFLNATDIYSVGYNPDRAKALAEQEGLVGQTLRIITNGEQQFNTMAEIIQNNLEAIGVHSQIINYDQATYFSLLMDESNYEIALYFVACPSLYAMDQMTMFPQFITQGWTHPDRETYSGIGFRGLATVDAKARGDLLFEQLGIFNKHHLWFAISEAVNPNAYSPVVTDVEFLLAGNIRYQDVTWAS